MVKDKLFGSAVKHRRKALGLTTAALAKQVDCSEANIRLIEKGSAPSVHLADSILRALGVKLTIGRSQGRRRLEL